MLVLNLSLRNWYIVYNNIVYYNIYIYRPSSFVVSKTYQNAQGGTDYRLNIKLKPTRYYHRAHGRTLYLYRDWDDILQYSKLILISLPTSITYKYNYKFSEERGDTNAKSDPKTQVSTRLLSAANNRRLRMALKWSNQVLERSPGISPPAEETWYRAKWGRCGMVWRGVVRCGVAWCVSLWTTLLSLGRQLVGTGKVREEEKGLGDFSSHRNDEGRGKHETSRRSFQFPGIGIRTSLAGEGGC